MQKYYHSLAELTHSANDENCRRDAAEDQQLEGNTAAHMKTSTVGVSTTK